MWVQSAIHRGALKVQLTACPCRVLYGTSVGMRGGCNSYDAAALPHTGKLPAGLCWGIRIIKPLSSGVKV